MKRADPDELLEKLEWFFDSAKALDLLTHAALLSEDDKFCTANALRHLGSQAANDSWSDVNCGMSATSASNTPEVPAITKTVLNLLGHRDLNVYLRKAAFMSLATMAYNNLPVVTVLEENRTLLIQAFDESVSFLESSSEDPSWRSHHEEAVAAGANLWCNMCFCRPDLRWWFEDPSGTTLLQDLLRISLKNDAFPYASERALVALHVMMWSATSAQLASLYDIAHAFNWRPKGRPLVRLWFLASACPPARTISTLVGTFSTEQLDVGAENPYDEDDSCQAPRSTIITRLGGENARVWARWLDDLATEKNGEFDLNERALMSAILLTSSYDWLGGHFDCLKWAMLLFPQSASHLWFSSRSAPPSSIGDAAADLERIRATVRTDFQGWPLVERRVVRTEVSEPDIAEPDVFAAAIELLQAELYYYILQLPYIADIAIVDGFIVIRSGWEDEDVPTGALKGLAKGVPLAVVETFVDTPSAAPPLSSPWHPDVDWAQMSDLMTAVYSESDVCWAIFWKATDVLLIPASFVSRVHEHTLNVGGVQRGFSILSNPPSSALCVVSLSDTESIELPTPTLARPIPDESTFNIATAYHRGNVVVTGEVRTRPSSDAHGNQTSVIYVSAALDDSEALHKLLGMAFFDSHGHFLGLVTSACEGSTTTFIASLPGGLDAGVDD